ncbi:WxL domain-containing protein [Carnobacterium maltaromaticum]|uniref:WxL domain-containing protein n=1 Tax=Carnobacterium maltaromaticum TaxID=2751 RepID=UPI000C75A9F9|nr:WxL domain-containing protein [Carnobacterium maltaromaticum]PLS35078.1 WxL domain-containing protein [Carnobacterium maltaromaticum]PLS35492.1 WxL domain-containing protein [Carnobacterium maltaromaticum]PLS35942.1 WxL domain-containing protein [Carnobacterium maltaromaticum]PLS42400.1 WxL domain-containing protein [Carnobacterium maltaromaticum]PLS45421.1 WxL domain-containing protein [Carnobacterium maltaromaticum]
MKLIKYGTTAAMLIGSLATTALPALAAEEDYTRTYQSGGMVEFVPDEGPTDPVDPVDPDPNKPVNPWDPTTPEHKPNPGTDGPLSIDFASSIDFGKNKITNKDETYFANPQYLWNEDMSDFDPATARPNYVQITDKRGNNGGWSLSVKQEGQFKNDKTLNKELTGSQITFTEGVSASNIENVIAPKTFDMALTPNTATKVMTAVKGAGAGTWVDRFGTLEDVEVEGKTVKKNKAITLDVPGTTAKDAVRYDTKLTWTLTDVPGNE